MDSIFDNEGHVDEKISLDQLYDRKREVDQFRLKIYQKILARIHNKIKHTSRIKVNEPYIFYIVPEFILGVPRYDVKHCTIYIIDKLETNGFQIKYTHPNMLFISWNHYIPSYQREIIYKKHGIKIDGFGNEIKKHITNHDIPTKTTNNKPYRTISSYKPGLGIYDKEHFKTNL